MLILLLAVLAQTPPVTRTPTRQVAAEQEALRSLAPAPPPDELNALAQLVGTWKCQGEIPASSTSEGPEKPKGSPAVPLRATMQIRRELQRHWYRFDTKTRAGIDWSQAGYFGYAGDRFVLFGVDSSGSNAHATATGWQLGKWTWEGEATVRGQTLPYRQTLTRPDDGTFEETRALQVNGSWQTISTMRCRH
jgi:hypothetical protein